jgi:serine protease Do
LVDIRGRVLGVLVPIAPQSTSEVAGAEWYDSGIGFAVPLASIGPALERMKAGKDQHAGVMGIGLAPENPHGSPAVLATVLASSPAGKAGLTKGDTIVEIDDRPIRTQTDLRFALGTHYAGDQVRIVATRDDETLVRSIELVGEFEPFRHAFLGILPMRDEPDAKPKLEPAEPATKAAARGIVVRMVYPGSPAAGAGIRAGDRVMSIDDTEIDSLKGAIDAMNNLLPGAQVAVRLLRGERSIDASLVANRLPTNVPSDLPPAYATPLQRADEEVNRPALELHELKLAEFPETCRVYLPPSHAAGRPAGVILWLHAPGEQPTDDLFREWQSTCDRDGLIFVAPTATDASRWERTELEYLRRLSERVLAEYQVDRNRVVVYGEEGGGAMAYLLALVSRDLFTGVATSAASLPRTVDPPKTDPTARLAVFAGLPNNESRLAQMELGLKKLADAGYPVTAYTIAARNGRLSDAERQQLAHWIDSLDRF